jgi:hypothetical protein
MDSQATMSGSAMTDGMMAGAFEPGAVGVDDHGPEAGPGSGSGRTEGGFENSRRNAVSHGLTANEVFPEALERLIAQLLAELTEHYLPRPGLEARLVRDLAVNMAKVEYCNDLRKLDRMRVEARARLCWEGDQQKVANRLAARLGKSPELVAPALAATLHGTQRLLAWWTGIVEAVATNGRLDEAQHGLVYDLLGVSVALRNGSQRVPAATDGPALKELASAEMNRLQRLQTEQLIELDEQWKALALAGMPYAADADTRNFRRYETTARNNANLIREEFRRARAEADAAEQARRERQFQDLATPPPVNPQPEAPAAPAAAAATAGNETAAESRPQRARQRVPITPPFSRPRPTTAPPVTPPAEPASADSDQGGPEEDQRFFDELRRQDKLREERLRKSAHRQAGKGRKHR